MPKISLDKRQNPAAAVSQAFLNLALFTFALLVTTILNAEVSSDLAASTTVEINDATKEDLQADGKIFAKAEAKYAKGKTRSARRLFKKVIRRYPDSPFAPEALALKAQIHKENENWIKCFKDLQRIVDEYPNYKNFNAVNNLQFNSATALMEGARGRIFWILPGFKQYSAAVYQFEKILENAPYSDLAPFALMNIALLSEEKGEFESAIDALDRLINYYPQSFIAPDAYYNLAQIYSDMVKGYQYDQGSTRRAISYYEDFLILYPNSRFAGEVSANLKKMENLLAKSRLDLGDFFYYYRSNNTAALVFYNEAITIAPDSDSAEEAQLRIEDIEIGVRPVSKASIIRKLLGVRY